MNKFKSTKIYVACPYNETGGPESLHQLVMELNQQGFKAMIYYVGTKVGPSPLYGMDKKFVTNNVEDKSENILIVTEIFLEELDKYKNITKMIWWLSLDFYLNKQSIYHKVKYWKDKKGKGTGYLLFKMFTYHLGIAGKQENRNAFHQKRKYSRHKSEFNKYYHMYNCEYVRRYLLTCGVEEKRMGYLCGPLHDIYFQQTIDITKKENIVLYNPKKNGEIGNQIIVELENRNIKTVPIIGMTSLEIIDVMKRSKVYIDLGFFPGPERIPREAAMMYCNILTSNQGSAGNDEDVKIDRKYKYDIRKSNISLICDKIEAMMEEYTDEIKGFDLYRKKIIEQKENFSAYIEEFFEGNYNNY